jgi:hypothetical protein
MTWQYLNPFPLSNKHIGLIYETKENQLVELICKKLVPNPYQGNLSPVWIVKPYPHQADSFYEVDSRGRSRGGGVGLQWYAPVEVRHLSDIEAVILSLSHNVVITETGQRVRFHNNRWHEVSDKGTVLLEGYWPDKDTKFYLWNCSKVQVSENIRAKLRKILSGNYKSNYNLTGVQND